MEFEIVIVVTIKRVGLNESWVATANTMVTLAVHPLSVLILRNQHRFFIQEYKW